MICPEVVQSPLARRTVSGLPCSAGAEGAAHTGDIVHEDKDAPTGPADDFENEIRVDGNTVPTEEGLLAVDLLEKGDEVANLVDSSFTGKWV